MRKGSHNSGTGERPKNFWARWFSFVAKCQDKTLKEQCEAGVCLFDLRVKYKDGCLYLAHGLAEYDVTLGMAITVIDRYAPANSVVMVTYEGKLDEDGEKKFIADVRSSWNSRVYVNDVYSIRLGNISVKKPTWKTIYASPWQPSYEQNYAKIVGWKVILPFPRVWKWWQKGLPPTPPKGKGVISMEDFV